MKNIKTIIILTFIIILAGILRFYKVAQNPPSLYWDEASLGYNAYSILKTGKDEHGELFPLARFIAFGDFKPPGYIYATVPSIALFGLNEFAVRLPSALSGVLLVIVSYFLADEVLKKKKSSLLCALLVAVSPWSLQLSRGAFEANLAASLNALAVLFILKLTKGKGWYIWFSSVFFVLSFYTFNANRIIAPLLFTVFLLYKIRVVLSEKKWLILSFLTILILISPSISYLLDRESRVRFQEVSIFTNLNILEKSNERIKLHNDSIIARIIHNRRLAYSGEFLKHFFDHFRTDFLFISGDKNPRLSTQTVGLLYLFSLPFLILGLIFFTKNYKKNAIPIYLWILIGIIPAAVSKETPHVLRTASVLPVYDLICAYGIWTVFSRLSGHLLYKVFSFLVSIVFLLNIYYYLHGYYVHYPLDWSGEWQYGYKELVKEVKKLEDQYDYIVITEALGRPYIYFLFYNQIDPDYFWKTREAQRDWFGFWTIDGFGKYRFGLSRKNDLSGKILVVGKENETKSLSNHYAQIYSPTGELIFDIASN